MTVENGRTEEPSGTELVESMASTSADLWNEILQRLNAVQEGHTRLTEAVDHLGEAVSGALAMEPEEDRYLSLGLGTPAVGDSTEVVPDVGDRSIEASTEHPWPAEPVVAEAPSRVGGPDVEVDGAQAPEPEKTEPIAAPELGVVTAKAEPEPTVTEPTVTEAAPAQTLEREAPPEAVAEPTIPEPEFVAAASEVALLSEAATEPTIREPEVAPAYEVASLPWLATEPTIPEPEVAPAHEVASVTEVAGFTPPTVGPLGTGIDTAGAIPPPSGGTGAVLGVRVLDPAQVLDLTPEQLDAVLAAEFGDAGDDLPGPDAISVQALLDAEFKPTGPVATTPEAPPLVPPATVESGLPPLPSAPLPPPPSNLLPPPPKPEAAGAVRPAPLGGMGANEPDQTLEPEASPPSNTVDAPSAEVGGFETAPPIPETSSPGAGREIPLLSFGSTAFSGEPPLPVEPPPIPEPALTDRGRPEAPTQPIEAAEHFEVAEPDLPPLSSDETPFTAIASPPSEPPPIPEAASTAKDKEARARVDPEAYLTASSMATEILAVRSAEDSQPSSEQEDTTAASAAEPPASNVVSQDFTIISKRHKRFRLR